jgi:3-methyladenine DNA glycosylase AlkD
VIEDFMTTAPPDAVAIAEELDDRLRALSKLSAEPIRALRREYTRLIAQWPAEVVVQLALELIRFDDFVHRVVAYELVRDHREALNSLKSRTLKQLGHGIDSWEDVDTFACYVDDRDDMVIKAMSWALRELAKRDAESVQAFIDEHEDRLAARVLREVRTKLRTGLKNPRRRPHPNKTQNLKLKQPAP